MLTQLELWFLWLILYSVFGWIYETILCSAEEKRFVNRGFLNGPYCPIYGSGAVLILLVLGRVQNPFALFFLGALLTCSLEYLTSFLLEWLFHARWWDYTGQFLNIKGRVCALGALVFGGFSVVLVLAVHPLVQQWTLRIPSLALHVISAVLLIGLVTDIVITVSGIGGLNEKLRGFADELTRQTEYITQTMQEHRENLTQRVRESTMYKTLAGAVAKTINGQERRMLKAFPKLRSLRYNELLSELRKRLRLGVPNKRKTRE